jgi:hypothetical protein
MMPTPKCIPDLDASVPPEIVLVLRELAGCLPLTLTLTAPGSLAYQRAPHEAADYNRCIKRAQTVLARLAERLQQPPAKGNGHRNGSKN